MTGNSPYSDSSPRRGWRETVEPGLWRSHRRGCKSSLDERPGRRCRCPYQFKAPHSRPGGTRTVTFHGPVSDARRERALLRGLGRPTVETQPAADEVTLRAFAHHYLQSKSAFLQRNTIETTARDYRLKVDPDLGQLPLAAITRAKVKEWLSKTLATESSRRSSQKALAALRVILSLAVEEDRIPINPAMGIPLPPPGPEARRAAKRVFNDEQLRLMIDPSRVGLRNATMFAAAGQAGLRRGEVIALRWSDVLFDEHRICVRQSAEQFPGVKRTKVTKSGRERRSAITPELVQLLADWWKESVVENGAAADGFVWPGSDGQQMDAGTPNQALRRSQEKAGLVDANGRHLVTFHGLRHTAVSIMFREGVAASTIAAQVGHANSGVTTSIYEHLVDDSQLDRAAAAFERR